ncbi:hypothetical protein HDU76_011438, partial [Blyttiomyces sp. JEL0837]
MSTAAKPGAGAATAIGKGNPPAAAAAKAPVASTQQASNIQGNIPSGGIDPTAAGQLQGIGILPDDLDAVGGSVPAGSVLLTVKVPSAKNVRGAKGEHVNSFIRVQFADFDFKESTVALDTPAPEYNFTYEQIFHIDENLVDVFNNKKVIITLIESLPKEKTQTLGTAEIPVSYFLKYPPRDPNGDPEAPLQLPSLTLKETISIS